MPFRRNEQPLTDHVLFAPEGFVDPQILPAIEGEQVHVIQVRYLADGPVIQYRPSGPMNH